MLTLAPRSGLGVPVRVFMAHQPPCPAVYSADEL